MKIRLKMPKFSVELDQPAMQKAIGEALLPRYRQEIAHVRDTGQLEAGFEVVRSGDIWTVDLRGYRDKRKRTGKVRNPKTGRLKKGNERKRRPAVVVYRSLAKRGNIPSLEVASEKAAIMADLEEAVLREINAQMADGRAVIKTGTSAALAPGINIKKG